MDILADVPYYALYPRVSLDRQKDNWSVKDQLGLARLAAPPARVVLYDADLGISGETIEARPDMTALLYDLAHGQISKPADTEGRPTDGEHLSGIICVDLNRLSRDQDGIDGHIIRKVCKDAGAVILTPGKTYDFETETDGLLAGIELLLSGSQKQKIVKAISRGLYQKAHDGDWPGGMVPYGYVAVYDVPHRDGRPRGRLVVHPERAEVVRLIFTLYVRGHARADGAWQPLTLAGVASVVNAMGKRLPARQRRDPAARGTPDRPFEASDINRILACRRVAGYKAWGGGRKALQKKNPYVRDFGPAEVFDATQQIVDAGLWLEAARLREQRARGPRRLAAPTRPLEGLLRCPRCGGHLTARVVATHGRPVLYYHCLPFRRFGRLEGRGCPEGGYAVTDAVGRAAVDDALEQLFRGVDLDRMLDEQVARERAASQEAGRAAVEAELDDVRLRRKRLVALAEEGALTAADVRERRLELDADEHRLAQRLGRLEQRVGATSSALLLAEQLKGRVPEYVRSLGARDPARYRQFLGWFFERLELDGTGRGVGRRVWLAGFVPTPAAAVLFAVPEGAWARPGAWRTPTDVPVMHNSQEWIWSAPLTLLLPGPAAPPAGSAPGG